MAKKLRITYHTYGYQCLKYRWLELNHRYIHIQIYTQKIISHHSLSMYLTIDDNLEVNIVDDLQWRWVAVRALICYKEGESEREREPFFYSIIIDHHYCGFVWCLVITMYYHFKARRITSDIQQKKILFIKINIQMHS